MEASPQDVSPGGVRQLGSRLGVSSALTSNVCPGGCSRLLYVAPFHKTAGLSQETFAQFHSWKLLSDSITPYQDSPPFSSHTDVQLAGLYPGRSLHLLPLTGHLPAACVIVMRAVPQIWNSLLYKVSSCREFASLKPQLNTSLQDVLWLILGIRF